MKMLPVNDGVADEETIEPDKRKELIEAVRKRRHKAALTTKTDILDEFVELTGYHQSMRSGFLGQVPSRNERRSCEYRRIGKAVSHLRSLNDINAARRRWWQPCSRCMCKMYPHEKSKPSPKSYAGMSSVVDHQSDRRATGCRVGGVRQAAPGRTISIPDLRCSLRKGAGRRSGAKPSRAGSHRDQLGRQAKRTRHGVGQPGKPLQLARAADRLVRKVAAWS